MVVIGNRTARRRHQLLFVGGLHRSGTGPLYRSLATSKQISCFKDTGVIEDEGQFLQTVYPTDQEFGGPGAFAFASDSHLTEESKIVKGAREKLFREWAVHWDLSKPILAEKSPGNLLKMRFLQEVFPDATFLMLTRHPVASCMAVSKWNKAYMTDLIEHWCSAHELMQKDIDHIKKVAVIRYEDLSSDPRLIQDTVYRLTGKEVADIEINFRTGLNSGYFNSWRKGQLHLNVANWKRPLKRVRNLIEFRKIVGNYEERINRFGYSFDEI